VRPRAERGAAAPVEAEVAEGGSCVQEDSQRRERDLPAVELLGAQLAGKRLDPERETAAQPASSAESAAISGTDQRSTRSAVAGCSGSPEAAAKAPATASPNGAASSKPAFLPSSTPGVASAWSPRKAAAETKASETRKRRP
jgi:hypothetical protein